MIARDRFALNRSVSPRLGLEEFFELAGRLEIRKVELRNDLVGGTLGGLSSEKVNSLARSLGIRIITINALQNFNSAARLPALIEELRKLLDVAASVVCEAIILCPTHSQADSRSRDEVHRETVGALRAFRPFFEESGLMGYLEPIGMSSCSLRSLGEATAAIRESRGACYRIVYDTFHHFTGADPAEYVEATYDVSLTGLVHASGVTSRTSPDRYTDDLRVMLSAADRIRTRDQIALLMRLGYNGNISFEPFSPKVQALDTKGIENEILRSIKLLEAIGD
ncbi:MAG: hypothetical protein A2V67_16125 [Deltaproteobacteria bacterium RBG_13_61_14]|nr:MAG: hypothetical protein A2V67_16125 [Deltaproteobacteria bacterium RBG_13_61_14]HXK37250.1 TIM barrel protein [Candidatus Paceibacterota bacterium]